MNEKIPYKWKLDFLGKQHVYPTPCPHGVSFLKQKKVRKSVKGIMTATIENVVIVPHVGDAACISCRSCGGYEIEEGQYIMNCRYLYDNGKKI